MQPPNYRFPTDDELRGRRVLVMGLGLYHGGATVVRFLAGLGCRITVTDLRGPEELRESLAEIADVPHRAVLGGHHEGDFRDCDWIVVSPAVSPDSPYLAHAVEHGVRLTSEVGLFFARLRAPIALVTGSKGKSTTTALLHRMAEAGAIEAVLGGNIGRPLLGEVGRLPPRARVVFEVSSFQLEQLAGLARDVDVAVITNLFPVHIDRHGTFERYVDAKRQVLQGARCAVLNGADPLVTKLADGFAGEVRFFSTEGRVPRGLWLDGDVVRDEAGRAAFARGDLRIPGVHNAGNAMAALLAAEAMGVDRSAALAALRQFDGLEHRLERVAEVDGVRFLNDSIATTPQSCLAALAAIDGPIVLIAGGKSAPFDLSALAPRIARRTKALIAIGETAESLAAAVEAERGEAIVERAADLAAAMSRARSLAVAGDTILLSPAFPSFDMFRNFKERGETFRKLARAGLAKPDSPR